MTRKTAVQMQSEIYNNPILVIQRRTVRCPLPSTTQESPVLRVERGAGLFPFLAVLGGIFDMPCTQDAPLYFTESDDNQPSRKRSREAAHWLHCVVNHRTVQSIRADGRYFTNQASIVFSRPISRQLCPRISGNPVRLESVHSFI